MADWRRWGGGPFAVPLAILAALAAVDALTGTQITGVYSGATLVASMRTDARRTAVVGALATATAVLAGTWQGNVGTHDWAIRALLCGLLSAVCIVAAGSRVRREDRLQRMSVIAEAAQRAVLRATPSAIGSIGFAARYVSATRDALIGGDLYEVAQTPHGVRVLVGDVRGKGIEAVQLAASVLGAFRQSSFGTPKLADVARQLDRVVAAVASDEDFVTAVLAEFHDDGRVLIVNCGHHAPLLLCVDGTVVSAEPAEPTLPLGMGSAPEMTWARWPVGSRLLMYTDGLVEARSAAGEFLRLDTQMDVLRQPSLDDALDGLIAKLLQHTGGELGDDMAVLLAERR